jgi:hypothetical protein
LTNVLVLMNQPTPTVTPSPVPTHDFSGAEEAYARAQQLIAAQDWPAAISALDEMRKLDPTYQTSLVDGMYYFALRNYGVNLINGGNLEGGIYQITLAERFGTIDRDANGLREGARIYLIGASFWELDWQTSRLLLRSGLSRLGRSVGRHHVCHHPLSIRLHALRRRPARQRRLLRRVHPIH